MAKKKLKQNQINEPSQASRSPKRLVIQAIERLPKNKSIPAPEHNCCLLLTKKNSIKASLLGVHPSKSYKPPQATAACVRLRPTTTHSTRPGRGHARWRRPPPKAVSLHGVLPKAEFFFFQRGVLAMGCSRFEKPQGVVSKKGFVGFSGIFLRFEKNLLVKPYW